ncbi:unnamed protein product [Toxocara canis]|uniref:Filaggrin-2-like n=1 Tax=Toxocara canis TaxID=6265 RepID=A0A183V4C9_TOXCA|nr:unnamed protein product [Toxocara canis]
MLGVLFVLFTCTECRLFGERVKRQTIVSSDTKTNGTAENVNTSALSDHYKTDNGVIGVNVSASGNAAGANSSSLHGSAFGSVGNNSVQGTGNVASTGTSSNSSTNIHAQIYGDNQTLSSEQQASGNGVGDTSASASGNSIIQQGGQNSPYSGTNNQATAGASGSLNSSASVIANQTLTWQSIISQLLGSAMSNGIGHAQSNVNLNGGNAENGVSANAVVSGVNNGGGVVSSQVNESATLNNNMHNVSNSLSGVANGTNDTSLVSASNIQSNVSGVNNSTHFSIIHQTQKFWQLRAASPQSKLLSKQQY